MIKCISSVETHNLRRTVLGDNISDYQYIYSGDDDEETTHIGYLENDEIVGILTIMKSEQTIFQFRGMAVSKNHQGKNIGGKLLSFASEFVSKDAKSIWLNAREKVIPFYKINGFIPEGEYFRIEPIGLHLKMSKVIS